MAPKTDVLDEKNTTKSQCCKAALVNLRQRDDFGPRLPHKYCQPDVKRLAEKLLPDDEKR